MRKLGEDRIHPLDKMKVTHEIERCNLSPLPRMSLGFRSTIRLVFGEEQTFIHDPPSCSFRLLFRRRGEEAGHGFF